MLPSMKTEVIRRIISKREGRADMTSGIRHKRSNHHNESPYDLEDAFPLERGSPDDGLLAPFILNLAEFKFELPPSALMLLLFLIASGSNQPISQRSLAERTGYSQSSIERNLKLLRERGYLAVGKQIDEATGVTINRYDFSPLKEKLDNLENTDEKSSCFLRIEED